MNAIDELKSQFSLNSENDDISDLEEYNNTQNTTLNSPLTPQNSVYSNRAVNSSGILPHQYGTVSNLTLPQIDELVAFPKHSIDSPRNSTTNFTRNVPPTYYPHSRRVDDAEGANIEVWYL